MERGESEVFVWGSIVLNFCIGMDVYKFLTLSFLSSVS